MSHVDPLPPVPLRRRALDAVELALYWTGVCALYVRFGEVRGATILMYHSVPADETEAGVDPRFSVPAPVFERQVRFLARHRRVIPLGDLVESIRNGRSPEPGTVVLTFDDGYRDNLEIAAPILARYGLPATLYLATGYVSGDVPQWIDRLYVAFRWRTVDLREPARVYAAYLELAERIIAAPPAERRRLLDGAERELRPSRRAPDLALSWKIAAELLRKHPHIEIGAHTRDHLDLTACDPSTARSQIEDSVRDVERELDRTPRHFCFPYGRSSPAVRALVAELGFESAVLAGQQELVDSSSDRLALPRFQAPDGLTRLRSCTSGAWPGLPRALRRRP